MTSEVKVKDCVHAGTVSVPIEGSDVRGEAAVYIHADDPGLALHVAEQLRRYFPHCRAHSEG